MAEEKRPPEDEQPLARPVHEQSLARPVGGEQEEATQAEGESPEARGAEEEEQQQQEAAQEGAAKEKGPLERVLDKAQENNWVYDSVAEKARETGLVSKADEVIDKARSRLTGG